MTRKYGPQILVLPEDDADRQIADGFILDPGVNQRRIQVLPPAGGWLKVLKSFERNHVADLRRWPDRVVVMVIDFDGREDPNRLDYAMKHVPAELQNRVFFLGARKDPQAIKRAMRDIGSLEAIGTALAQDCRANTRVVWSRPELARNSGELERLNAEGVKAWLFHRASEEEIE